MLLSDLGGQDFRTGAFISETGEILTTSEGAWNPVVDVRLRDGTQGQACVIGRDDDIGLALFESNIETPRSHHFLTLSNESASVGDELQLVHVSGPSATPKQQTTQVVRYERFDSGYSYLQMLADDSTPEGAVLINNGNELQGIRMPERWRQRQGLGILPGVYAVDAPEVTSIALPVLRTKRIFIRLPSDAPSYPPDAWAAAYYGKVTLDGAPAPAGTRLWVRLSKEGQPDHWDFTTIRDAGFFHITMEAPYLWEAAMEFWMDCRRSSTTATFDYNFFNPAQLSLTF